MFQRLKRLHSSPLESPIGSSKQMYNSEISSIYMRPGNRQTESKTGRWKHMEYMGFPEAVLICLTCPHSFITPDTQFPPSHIKHIIRSFLCSVTCIHADRCLVIVSGGKNYPKESLYIMIFFCVCVKVKDKKKVKNNIQYK